MARGSHSSGRSNRAGARRSAARTGHRSTGLRLRLPRLGSDPGDRLIAAGGFLFALGLIAIGITFVPFIALQRSNTDLAVSLGTFATVIGLALVVVGAYQQARSLHR